MRMLQWTGATGLAAVVTYVGTTIAGSLLNPSYVQMSQRVGDLTATRASTAPALTPAYAFYNVLVLAFAIGLYLTSFRDLKSKMALRLLTINALSGVLMVTWFRQSSRGYAVTVGNAGNIGFACVSALAMLIGLWAYGFSFRQGEVWRSLSLFSFGIGGALAVSEAVTVTTVVSDAHIIGVAERVVMALFILWIGVTSCNALLQASRLRLLREERRGEAT